MAAGPLPTPNRRRRNAPTFATSRLDSEGRSGRKPACPYKLGDAGKKFWTWAWETPQALKWGDWARYTVARRAALEDDLENLDLVNTLGICDLLEMDEGSEMAQRLDSILKTLKRLAGNKMAVIKADRKSTRLNS